MDNCEVCNLNIEIEDSVVNSDKVGWIHQGCSDLRKIRDGSMVVATIGGSYVEGKVTSVGEGSGLPKYEIGIDTVAGEVFINRSKVKSIYNG